MMLVSFSLSLMLRWPIVIQKVLLVLFGNTGWVGVIKSPSPFVQVLRTALAQKLALLKRTQH